MQYVNVLKNSAEIYSDVVAIVDERNNIEKTYFQLYNDVISLAKTFYKFGLNRLENVCVFSENNGNLIAVEQGLKHIGCVPVMRGSVFSPMQELDFIYEDSESVGLITDSLNVIDYFKSKLTFCNRNKFIVYIGAEDVILSDDVLTYEQAVTYAQKEDISLPKININDTAMIVYSSGTSGNVKGVMLSHYSISYIMQVTQNRVKFKTKGKYFLLNPLWHSGPYITNLFFMFLGSTIYYYKKNEYLYKLQEHKPENLEGVPKTFDVLYGAYQDEIQNKSKLNKFIFDIAYKIALKYRCSEGIVLNKISQKITIFDFISALIFTILLLIPQVIVKYFVLYPLRKIYLPNRAVLYTAGAALDRKVEDFFNLIGITTYQKYGLSETCSILTNQNVKNSKYYTVGLAHDGVEIKILDLETKEIQPSFKPGMICAKAPQNMLGYYNHEAETKKMFDADGFLITGDIGYMDDEGFITYITRYKDIIVLQNGENIAASVIEMTCREIPYIEQFVLCGQDRDYLTAIVFLNDKKLDILKEQILTDVLEKNSARNNYKNFEKIKDILIYKYSDVNFERYYTNTQKFKRYKFYEDFSNEIENMYK